MATTPLGSIDQASPPETWSALRDLPKTQLIDVRTRPEWAFVGVPDLSPLGKEAAFSEWVQYPAMTPNPRFLADLDAMVREADAETVYFLCRSGGRSQAAALAALAHFSAQGRAIACVNVLEGFEGDLDAAGHRGARGGWKAHGLAWRQS